MLVTVGFNDTFEIGNGCCHSFSKIIIHSLLKKRTIKQRVGACSAQTEQKVLRSVHAIQTSSPKIENHNSEFDAFDKNTYDVFPSYESMRFSHGRVFFSLFPCM
jgi:hypothetical protein